MRGRRTDNAGFRPLAAPHDPSFRRLLTRFGADARVDFHSVVTYLVFTL